MNPNNRRPTAIPTEARLLPHNPEVERLVLGTLMTDRNALPEVNELLNPESFYDPFHQSIYRAICHIESQGNRADMLTVMNELRKGNDFNLDKFLPIAQSYTFDLYQHAAILHDKEKRRRFFEIGQYLTSNAFTETEDIADVFTQANEMLSGILQLAENNIHQLRDIIGNVYKIIDRNASSESIITGSPTGFKAFDRKSGGLQKSDLVIIAGETSQGKTSLALSIARQIAHAQGRIAIYSLEMTKEQLTARLMAMESGVPANEILFSRLQPFQYEMIDQTVSSLYDACILFDDRSTSNIDTIIASIRSMVIKHHIDGVVIDYLQILNVNMKGSNKEQQMGEVARRLKNLAKELNIWIAALSQLNRDHTNPVPNLNRLRDSGQIAEAADIVMFVYRPEMYGKNYPDPFHNYPTQRTAMVDIAKGRNIGVLKFICGFDKRTSHFMELDDMPAGMEDYYSPDENPF